MNRFIVVPIICILLLLESTAAAAGAVITCTVTIAEPAPFTVEVTSSAPNNTVEQGQEFQVVAALQNIISTKVSVTGAGGDKTMRIKHVTARIDFDISGLTLLRPKQVQNLGTITARNVNNKSVWWELEGVKKGTYVVQVTISGVNQAGNPVVTQSSINITVQEPSSIGSHETSSLFFPGWTNLQPVLFGVDIDLTRKDNFC